MRRAAPALEAEPSSNRRSELRLAGNDDSVHRDARSERWCCRSPPVSGPASKCCVTHVVDVLHLPQLIAIQVRIRGTTPEQVPEPTAVLVSIHAPIEGATGARLSVRRTGHRFNPRTRVRSDLGRRSRGRSAARFNPRSRVRSDDPQLKELEKDIRFQSTLPREERPFLERFDVRIRSFQSTLPREERHLRDRRIAHAPAFQSTLPREERP